MPKHDPSAMQSPFQGEGKLALSVAICTWNRAALLDATLQSFAQLHLPAGLNWELLIVNNNCTDETDVVASKYAGPLPIRIVHELQSGLSHGRNRALAEVKSDWVIYTDDDVLLDPEWLAAYHKTITAIEPNVAFLGGAILPWFETEPAPGLVEGIPTVGRGFCGVDPPLNPVVKRIGDPIPIGANFAVHRPSLGDMKFDPRLGVQGKARLSSEEHEFLRRLLDHGFEGRWIADASLRHFVPKSRMELKYLTRHIYDLGRTAIILNGTPHGRRLCGVPVWMLREIVTSSLLVPVTWLFRRRAAFYRHVSIVSSRLGMARECFFRKDANCVQPS